MVSEYSIEQKKNIFGHFCILKVLSVHFNCISLSFKGVELKRAFFNGEGGITYFTLVMVFGI